MRTAAPPIFFHAEIHGIDWCAVRAPRAAAELRSMVRLPSHADCEGSPLLWMQLVTLHCGCGSSSYRAPVANLPPPQCQENGQASSRCLLQLSSGVKATGGRAESEGAAHVCDFPSRPRFRAVYVAASDTVNEGLPYSKESFEHGSLLSQRSPE